MNTAKLGGCADGPNDEPVRMTEGRHLDLAQEEPEEDDDQEWYNTVQKNMARLTASNSRATTPTNASTWRYLDARRRDNLTSVLSLPHALGEFKERSGLRVVGVVKESLRQFDKLLKISTTSLQNVVRNTLINVLQPF